LGSTFEFASCAIHAAELRDIVRYPGVANGAKAKNIYGDGTVQRGADATTEGRDRAQETGGRVANQTQNVGNQTGGVSETDEGKDGQALPHGQDASIPRQRHPRAVEGASSAQCAPRALGLEL
jgi:hypothetical protein